MSTAPAPRDPGRPLSGRQEGILRAVVERFIATGAPVGSRHIAGAGGIDFASSTVRYELARLEDMGYLGHPHTSAGRVPTDRGYRYYVDVLLPADPPAAPPGGLVAIERALDLGEMRKEVDAALQNLAEVVSQLTCLLGVVTAPAPQAATVRHVEVLLLQPQLVMAVVITSTGAVHKRIFAFEGAVDPGLVDWARAFFNERVTGMPVGARILESRLADPSLSARERAFADALSPAVTEVADAAPEHLYVAGQARFLADARQDLAAIGALMEQLEQRATLLDMLRRALSRHEVYLHIGEELAAPGLRGLSMVAANYGVARRNLGTISLIGPTRMDYRLAIGTVREAATALSRYLEGVYE
jgi:heat-inducible transcriptional repressor